MFDEVVLLWCFAVFLASVLSSIIVGVTLKPKYSKTLTFFGWLGVAVVGFGLSWLSYTVNLYSDLFGILGLSAMVCLMTCILYSESWSTKLFVALMACLISNVITFMFCGTTDTFLGKKLHFYTDTPYTVKNILFFIGIKVVVYLIVLVLYIAFLRKKVKAINVTLDGKMHNYIAAPAVSVIVFYVVNWISNSAGIFPGTTYFFPLYLSICTVLILEYVQIFSSVSWSAKAMKNAAELNVASKIQQDMLPSIFPAFPEREEFDLYASMDPAKAVGGDFYDFFLIDDDHLGMVIADVSDKGVPAALFMMISKTLIKNTAMMGGTPHEILESVNHQLCESNDSMMFVTVWFAIMEISTGKVVASNAGHEYPAYYSEKRGTFELVDDQHGMALGVMDGMPQTDYEFVMEPGDMIYVYTDGVAEATNGSNELYDTDRMILALNRAGTRNPEYILHRLREDIDQFVGKAPQFDDLTMLALTYKGSKSSRK